MCVRKREVSFFLITNKHYGAGRVVVRLIHSIII